MVIICTVAGRELRLMGSPTTASAHFLRLHSETTDYCRIHIADILHVYCTYIAHILHVYCTYIKRILHVYCSYIAHILHVYCTYIAHILNVYCTYIARILRCGDNCVCCCILHCSTDDCIYCINICFLFYFLRVSSETI